MFEMILNTPLVLVLYLLNLVSGALDTVHSNSNDK